jgi:hypothetical protein
MDSMLSELMRKLIASVGTSNVDVTNEEVKVLERNFQKIDVNLIHEYQEKIVKHLLNLKIREISVVCSEEIISKRKGKPHVGDCIEAELGIKNNPSTMGDLMGLELKSGSIDSSSPLSLTTISIELDLKKYMKVDNINEVLCSPPNNKLLNSGELRIQGRYENRTECRYNSAGDLVCNNSNHVLKVNESLRNNVPSKLGRFKFQIDSNTGTFQFYIRKTINDRWEEIGKPRNLLKVWSKFSYGILYVLVDKSQVTLDQSNRFRILKLYYLPITREFLMNQIIDGKYPFEIRYDRKYLREKDKSKNYIHDFGKSGKSKFWDGYTFDNTSGWGFRIQKSLVKSMLTEETEIKTLDEFKHKMSEYKSALFEKSLSFDKNYHKESENVDRAAIKTMNSNLSDFFK